MVARKLLAGLVVVLVLAPGVARADKRRGIAELTNFALGAEYSQWLVGPIARIATTDEIEDFLSLTDDQAAAEFVAAFWQKRDDPSTPWPDKQPRAVFERRAEEADKKFTEGVALGRRSDRGEIFILFGEPPEIDYENDRDSRVGPIEVWRYGKKSPRGLGGEKPKKLYRFVKRGEKTVFYTSSPSPSRRRSRGAIE